MTAMTSEPVVRATVWPDEVPAALAACGVAAAGVVAIAHRGHPLLALAYVALVLVLVPIVAVDLAELRVPDRLVLPAVAVALAATTGAGLLAGQPRLPIAAVVGGLLFAGPLLAMHVARPEGLGFGDVKLGLLLGVALGVSHPVLAPLGLLAGCGAELLTRAALRRWRGAQPFAPALAAGAVTTLLVGGPVVRVLEMGWSW